MPPEVMTMPWALAQLFILVFEEETKEPVMRLCAKIEAAANDDNDPESAPKDLLEMFIDSDDPGDMEALAVWTEFLFDIGLMALSEAENISSLARGTLFQRILDGISKSADKPTADAQGA